MLSTVTRLSATCVRKRLLKRSSAAATPRRERTPVMFTCPLCGKMTATWRQSCSRITTKLRLRFSGEQSRGRCSRKWNLTLCWLGG